MTSEEVNWTMPCPDTGCTVKVFPNGQPDETPHFAFVAKANDRSIDVRSPLGTSRGGVRHISDPFFNRSDDLRREYGAWDFTDETKALRASESRFVALEKRVKTLEELLEKKTK